MTPSNSFVVLFKTVYRILFFLLFSKNACVYACHLYNIISIIYQLRIYLAWISFLFFFLYPKEMRKTTTTTMSKYKKTNELDVVAKASYKWWERIIFFWGKREGEHGTRPDDYYFHFLMHSTYITPGLCLTITYIHVYILFANWRV